MSSSSALEECEQRLQALLADYQYRVVYGNLRAQRSEWPGQDGVVNFALVYELPGGSTSQINVDYHPTNDSFCIMDVDTAEERNCSDAEAALELVRESIARIPERRLRRLREDIDRWFGEGKSSHEMFAEINKLLQTDFKGGSLTHRELKAGINYILELGKKKAPGG
ncbi:MAG: hypothetical protein JSV65_12095 [Armatimonadota bacterium]|nr:MAG: hypothetical protein JSV65_12095 [Armatimonadota bacterium]